MSRGASTLLAALLATGCAGAQARRTPLLPVESEAATALPLDGLTPAALDHAAPREPAVPAPDRPAVAAAKDGLAEERPGRAARPGERRGSPGAQDDARADERDGEGATALRARVLEAARRLLGKRPRLDCSGYVLAAFAAAGVTVELEPARSRTESLYRASRPVTRPRPGDLVFFHDTHDRDRNGRRGDRFTHVALVEASDGTALTLLHRGGRRVERVRMDLSRPSDPAANDPVRVRRRRDPRGTRYLSGELFTAFGGLLGEDVAPKLQARRGRDTSAREPARR